MVALAATLGISNARCRAYLSDAESQFVLMAWLTAPSPDRMKLDAALTADDSSDCPGHLDTTLG